VSSWKSVVGCVDVTVNKVQCKPTLRLQNRNGQGAWYGYRDGRVWRESKSRHDEEATVG
jgi:hypothetical protein